MVLVVVAVVVVVVVSVAVEQLVAAEVSIVAMAVSPKRSLAVDPNLTANKALFYIYN